MISNATNPLKESRKESLLRCAVFSSLTQSSNSKVSVQIQIKPTFQCEFVPQCIEKSDFLDLADAGDGAFSVETVISSFDVL